MTAMHDHHRLLQRELDGALGAAEAAGVRQLVADRPDLAQQADRLQRLDADLRGLAQPLSSVTAATVLQERICASLPLSPPIAQVSFRLVDLGFAAAVAAMLFVTYGVVGTAARNLFQEAVLLTWMMGLSLIAGLAMVLVPGFLRSLESGVLGRLIGRPIAIGPTDVLVYRAAGFALVVGGLWLGR